MRLLFVSNYYPPFARGGYEQWCEEVAVALGSRGHNVHVLTAKVGDEPPYSTENEVKVYRMLNLEVVGGLWQTAVRLWHHRNRLEAENLDTIREIIVDVQPDVVMMWGMWNVPCSVPELIEQMLPTQTVYYFCDYWPTLPSSYVQQLQNPARSQVTQIPKKVISRFFLPQLLAEPEIALQFPHAICVSRAVRERLVAKDVPVEHAQVVYGGTQVDQFAAHAKETSADNRLKLLYIGRLSAEKDVKTVLDAMEWLKGKPVTLDVVGSGDPDYETALRVLAADRDLKVHFWGRVSREQIPAIMAQHDALVFTSKWPEPFARTVLEAMVAGLVVIGTTTGGTGEILVEDETGLTFPVGETAVLVAQIQRLYNEPALRQRLAQAGKNRILADFTFTRMVDEIEQSLDRIVGISQSTIH